MTDVVQLKPGATLFDYCFAIVREERSWGIICDVIGPTLNDAERAPLIYPVRVTKGNYHVIGKAQWDTET